MTMPVPLPPLEEQRKIVEKIEAQFRMADTKEERLALAQNLTERMWPQVLARAVRGRLVATEAELAREEGREYEPATDLLDRMSAGRLVQRTARKGTVESTGGIISAAALAAIRQACWGAGTLEPDELIVKVARRLKCRLGKGVREWLQKHLEVALERRIIAREGDRLVGATPTFGRYDYHFLVRTAYRLLGSGEPRANEDLVEAVATYLGFSQVTPAIRVRMERVLRWAHQGRLLVYQDGKVRRLG
jgi:hypothetical protein